MKEALSEAGIKFVYFDISSGMLPLKKFLKYRDERPEFAPIKEAGRVGLPCIVVEDDEKGVQVLFELSENLDELK